MTINTEVPAVSVEIDGKEYALAPKTAALAEKLAQAERDAMGKPGYKLWLAELELILGKPACRELFRDGKNENLDRLQMIYAGVSKAFNHTDDEIAAEQQEDKLRALTDALAPVNELLRHLRAIDAGGGRKEIRRP